MGIFPERIDMKSGLSLLFPTRGGRGRFGRQRLWPSFDIIEEFRHNISALLFSACLKYQWELDLLKTRAILNCDGSRRSRACPQTESRFRVNSTVSRKTPDSVSPSEISKVVEAVRESSLGSSDSKLRRFSCPSSNVLTSCRDHIRASGKRFALSITRSISLWATSDSD